jgi:hypothetical protein
MGKVIGLLISAIITIIGLILLTAWWYEFLFVIRGVLPLILVFGGLIWLVAGFTEMKDIMADKGKK